MATITSPWGALLTLQDELDRVLRSPRSAWFTGQRTASVYPPINVFENETGWVIRAELPGVEPDAVQLTCEGRQIQISGERSATNGADGSDHRRERPSGKFSRSLMLPEDLDLGRAEAKFHDGLLTIEVPHRPESSPRRIPVQASA